jgi:hypothetical protein
VQLGWGGSKDECPLGVSTEHGITPDCLLHSSLLLSFAIQHPASTFGWRETSSAGGSTVNNWAGSLVFLRPNLTASRKSHGWRSLVRDGRVSRLISWKGRLGDFGLEVASYCFWIPVSGSVEGCMQSARKGIWRYCCQSAAWVSQGIQKGVKKFKCLEGGSNEAP